MWREVYPVAFFAQREASSFALNLKRKFGVFCFTMWREVYPVAFFAQREASSFALNLKRKFGVFCFL